MELEEYKALDKHCLVDPEQMANKLYVANNGEMNLYNRTTGNRKIDESFESIVKALISWYEQTGIYTPIIYK